MTFCDRERVRQVIEGKTVALVGSGPGVLRNPAGFIDSRDVVVRVNNYKLSDAAGRRTDVFYSFFGASIRKRREDLIRDGVTLCMAKCPDDQFIESEWHAANCKMRGVDFRAIYRDRADWWFCDTYVPSTADFVRHFEVLGNHVPTTGFAALLDILSFNPANVYMTGFDFFQSYLHNVNEPWRKVNIDDPIGHVPDVERQWLADNLSRLPIVCDDQLTEALSGKVRPPRIVLRRVRAEESRRARQALVARL